MKRGKDDDKTMGPMFPRLHVNDTEKGGPKAPPRNKMALYEQLSISSQRFNADMPSSSTRTAMSERSSFSSLQQSSPNHSTRKQEHKRLHEEDDFTVPIFDQQFGTSQSQDVSHQNRGNEGVNPSSGCLVNNHNTKLNNNKFQKENPQDFAALKDTNESSTFSIRNDPINRNLIDNGVDSQADNTLWGDSVVNETSKASDYGNNLGPLREIQNEGLRSPNDPVNGDAVSENSMVDSTCAVDVSPDDVVGIIGQKHFWKARRAIVNQQRVFSVQVFELHRLIKVQRLIAGSPHLLVDENAYFAKPPKVKKIPVEYIPKSTTDTRKNITDSEKPNDNMEFSAENAVGKSSLQNVSQTTYCRPFNGPPSDQNMGSWNFHPPPGPHWLIPVMSPSEGLVYKPYPANGFINPVYGGYGSIPVTGSTGVNHFTPIPSGHGYFPAYNMQMANPSGSSSTMVNPTNPFNQQHQGSTNIQTKKNGHAVPNVVKYNNAAKDTEVQASTASSRINRKKDQNALPLFPTTAPEPTRVETVGPPRVIRVVPHNARSATACVARIFKSIQEERKQHDLG